MQTKLMAGLLILEIIMFIVMPFVAYRWFNRWFTGMSICCMGVGYLALIAILIIRGG